MTCWDQIRTEYINGGISQRALAKKHGVSYKSLTNHARSERWAEERRRIAAEARAAAGDLLMQRKAESMAAIADAFGDLAQTLKTASAELRSLSPQEQLVFQGTVRGLTGSLQDLVRVAADLYQRPTVSEQIQRERLELMVRQYNDEKAQTAAAADMLWHIVVDGNALDKIDEVCQ